MSRKAQPPRRREDIPFPMPMDPCDGESFKNPDTNYSSNYIPLRGAERRARRELLLRAGDRFVDATLRDQEVRELQEVELKLATFGDDVEPWRVSMCLEARKDLQVQHEVAERLGAAVAKGEVEELEKFAACMEAIARYKTNGAVNLAKQLAITFTWGYCAHHWKPPTQAQVRRYLVECGKARNNAALQRYGDTTSSERKNEARDVFNGPILGALPKAKGGRKTSVKHPEKLR